MFHENVYFLKWARLIYIVSLYYPAFYHLQIFISYKGEKLLAEPTLTFKRRIKSHLPFAGIIRSSPYSPRFQDNG